MTVIHLVNQSAKISKSQANALAQGGQKYANLVAKAWGLESVKVTTTPTDGAWEFYLVDKFPADGPTGALGYHDVKDGKVVAYISTEITMGVIPGLPIPSPFGTIIPAFGGLPETLFGPSVFETLTHEIAEALVDPLINRYHLDENTGKAWLVEVGDQAGAYRFKVSIKFGPLLKTINMVAQDFTLPAFYTRTNPGPYSYTGKVTAPFQVDVEGCYAYMIPAGAGIKVGFDKD